ncbi:MAG: hypothetical protein Q4C47_05640 [Planctomycetia bacterium]|nr:hypothetical protein [Planctomycetia bacterium]
MNQEINVLALVKGKERYIFLFDDTSRNRTRLFRTLRRFASCPELSFTWYDAAALGQKIRQSCLPVNDDDDCVISDAYDSDCGRTASSFTVRRGTAPQPAEPVDSENDDDFSPGWWD